MGLDDKCAGKMRMSGSNAIAENDKRVPIERKLLLAMLFGISQ